MDLATCLFTGLGNLQEDECDHSDQITGSTQHKIFAKDVIRFVRRKELRKLPNPFDIPDEYFKRAFRLDKLLFQDLLLVLCLRTYYRPETDTHRTPFDLRLLIALAYLAQGNFEALQPLEAFRGVTTMMKVHCVPEMCQMIVYFLSTDYIVFPPTTEEALAIKRGFFAQYKVPNVVGIMDCFHIKLSKVKESEQENYKCRHGNLAINVQVICDHNLRFLNVNPRAPGSVSDTFIWKRSHISSIMKNLYQKEPTWLIADRGYKLEDVLLNPYRNPHSGSEQRLNAVFEQMLGHIDTAVVMLTSRFRCLKTILPYNHQTVANIVTACATLHNYFLSKNFAIEEQLMLSLPKRRTLPNAIFEDEWSAVGYQNREYVKAYLNGCYT